MTRPAPARTNDRFSCLDVATATALDFYRKTGSEHVYRCPRHDDQHPSLSINPDKDTWMCGPCGGKGTAWDLLAFIGRVDPGDKQAMYKLRVQYGLTDSSGNGNQLPHSNGKGGRRILATYPYHDEHGSVIFENVRYEPKDFKQRRPDGHGGWIWNLNGVRRPLYRLPEVRRAVDLFIVEGEKDADNLHRLGLTGTTNGAAGQWRDDHTAGLQVHQHVVIIPDNDDPGRKHAHQVAAALSGKVASIKILELPGLPAKGDVSDWLAGKDLDTAAEELTKLADGAPEWKPTQENKSYIEFAPAFLSGEDPPIQYLVEDLLPEGVIALMHGDPRTKKSWAALDMAIALATGTPAFNLPRFRVPSAVPVLYSSQEDGRYLFRIRAKALLRHRGIDQFPPTLAFSVFKGIDLESIEWHEILIRDVSRHGFRALFFDPIRRYGKDVDKGPAEVRAITGYLRRLVIETGTTVDIIHHDVKPPAAGKDERRRSHRASGGDWFAAADCPIGFEAAGETCSVVYPEQYKFSSDPQPFTFRLETDNPRHPITAKLIGESTTAEDAASLDLTKKMLTYLAEHPGKSGSAIAAAIHARKENVLDVLDKLFNAGKVDAIEHGKSKLWHKRGRP